MNQKSTFRIKVVTVRTWKGSISFGLINIPVGVYLATKNADFSFNQLCTNGHRIRYQKWCPDEEREVSYSEIKGL